MLKGKAMSARCGSPSVMDAQVAPREELFDVPGLLLEARTREEELVDRLRCLVEIESPSSDKEAVERAQILFAQWGIAAGGLIERHEHVGYGDSFEVRFNDQVSAADERILLLGHLDTVWNCGTLDTMPWKATKDVLAGPGVLDMKAGVMMGLTAIEILKDLDLLRRPITILLHGDEEVGSPASRTVTESVARQCRAVYVLEPAQGEAGAYKTARKAVGMYRVSVHGRAAHSGVDFESGHSAILELAKQLQVISTFTDLPRGITVNPGLIGGGTRSNVIAAEAWAEIDVRLARGRDMQTMDRKLRGLVAHDNMCRVAVTGEINRPPMERNEATVNLFERAKRLAAQMGIPLDEAATGGGSDGNFTSALGVPTLDGMGAVGSGAHANHEHLERKHLAPRTALLAAMMI